MNYKHGDKVIVYKFFQGVLSQEFGEKRINPYGKEGKFLGIIDIMGERRRSVQCSTKPGVIRNNFVWYPAEEGMTISSQKAIDIFKQRTERMFNEYSAKLDSLNDDRKYLDDCLTGPVYIDNKGMFHTPNKEDKE